MTLKVVPIRALGEDAYPARIDHDIQPRRQFAYEEVHGVGLVRCRGRQGDEQRESLERGRADLIEDVLECVGQEEQPALRWGRLEVEEVTQVRDDDLPALIVHVR
ncbi:hypothetical protein Q664_27785 [Archangium violaceum Cb vi76]|uniref:Uncharacterized protein n=1 Tax=Archangium violaceum Cb vi76 TaxID=1406225 RepID=A0A084SQ23_9BACT|nr:hypothetical protein Q664_27785 [Archangium violaceum Cb vi76]